MQIGNNDSSYIELHIVPEVYVSAEVHTLRSILAEARVRRNTNLFSYKPWDISHPLCHGFSGRAHIEPWNGHDIPSGSYRFVQGSQWNFNFLVRLRTWDITTPLSRKPQI